MEKVEVIKPDTVIDPATPQFRREHRRYMLRKLRQAAKWSLIAAGTVAVAQRLTTRETNEEETEEV